MLLLQQLARTAASDDAGKAGGSEGPVEELHSTQVAGEWVGRGWVEGGEGGCM